ncbi:short-subunit dehydrogenase [Pedobacter sp. W3I1]|uniref:SDR family oxidoreductase n=1 Tax=Pedobacter sp. W3I1 TaxID=3042291 RepID=UPI0027891C24|nr:SDR family oxidoreductase [Pedobacter sp. W3I1]MDQ0637826.1 short-subunit dehydrogenase [Pedobacter sp. W3I1]
MMMKEKRTVVITGASSGAGRAIAAVFAQNGDRLVISSRNKDELGLLAKECELLGAEVMAVEADVSDYKSVINLAASADDFGSGIDIWINNAGVLAIGEFDTTPMEVSEQVLRTNLLGYMNGAHAVLPYFKKQGSGIIINNISIGGFLPVPYGVAYSASKFGLRGFSAALKAELSKFPNIYICDAFPAFLDTPGIQHAANYTGKSLKPAPPVYDPMRVALSILKLSKTPKSQTMIGSTSILLRLSYAIFPALTRGIAGKVISSYLKHAPGIEKTNGNIFSPLPFGNAIYGGWGIAGKPKAHRKYLAGAVLLFFGTAFLLTKK